MACQRDEKGPNEQSVTLLWALYDLDLNVWMVSMCSLWTHSNQQAAPFTVHQSFHCKSHTDEFTTIPLHTGDNKKVKRLFYANCAFPNDGPNETRNMCELTCYNIIVIRTSFLHLFAYIMVNVACSLEINCQISIAVIESVFNLVDITIKI